MMTVMVLALACVVNYDCKCDATICRSLTDSSRFVIHDLNNKGHSRKFEGIKNEQTQVSVTVLNKTIETYMER
jgi:hypothetical protein